MSKNLNEAILNKLLALTEQKTLKWKSIPSYLDENKNEPLRRYLIGAEKYYYAQGESNVPMMMEYRSYCAEFNSGLVLLFVYSESMSLSYELAIQTDSSNLVEKLSENDKYQDALTNLISAIAASKNTTESFLNALLES